MSVWAFHNVSADGAQRVCKKRKKGCTNSSPLTGYVTLQNSTLNPLFFKHWSFISYEINSTLSLFAIFRTFLFSFESPCSCVSMTKSSLVQETDGQESRPLDKRRGGREPEKLEGENTEEREQTSDCRADNRAAPYQQNMFHMITLLNIAMTNSGSWNSRLIVSHCLPGQLHYRTC